MRRGAKILIALLFVAMFLVFVGPTVLQLFGIMGGGFDPS